jgi:hypothetical protein
MGAHLKVWPSKMTVVGVSAKKIFGTVGMKRELSFFRKQSKFEKSRPKLFPFQNPPKPHFSRPKCNPFF